MLVYCTKANTEVSIFFLLSINLDHTCNRSSKSRAASFFISEAFVAKHLIVLEPNVGILLKLVIMERLFIAGEKKAKFDLPLIQLCDQTAIRGCSIQNTNQVGKKSFPDTQFKLMQKINNKHARDIKVGAKFIDKCILRMKVQCSNE
jgi:hypothetical protein